MLGDRPRGGGGRGRQPAAITAGPVSSATIIAGSLPVYLRALPSAFLLLTVASPLRLCKGYALARRVEQRVGSPLSIRCLETSGMESRHDSIPRGYFRRLERYSLKVIGTGKLRWHGSRIRVQERIYIYKYLRDTSYDGRFVETMAARWGTKGIGYIDVRFIIAVKFPRRERLISLCERSSPIHRDEMISLIAFGYVHICLFWED